MPDDMTNAEPRSWSEGTDARTRDLLTGGSVPMLDVMPMKHVDGRFGTVPLGYAISPGTGPVEVTVRRSGEVLSYPSLDALIAAGWAVD